MELRPGTSDVDTARNAAHDYIGLTCTGTVLDVGACFGAFAIWALGQGAQRVICIEPEPDNYNLLRRNVAGLHVAACRAAVVPYNYQAKQVSFYVNPGKGKGMHSLVVKQGRNCIKVPAVKFIDLLDCYQPTTVKMDIEGGEWLLRKELSMLPSYVRHFAMELHLNRKVWRSRGQEFLDSFAHTGWKVVKLGKITEKNWHTQPVWTRD